MECLHKREATNEVINEVLKPLNIYFVKLYDWVFNTLQSSMMKDFPNMFYYTRLANTLYSNSEHDYDELQKALIIEVSNKLMPGLLLICMVH